MNSLQTIFSNPQLSFDPLNFIGLLATVIVSIYIFKSEIPFSYIKERHEKLIFPIFNLLEPVLYQQANDDIWNRVFSIIEENKSFVDGRLLRIYYYCKIKPSNENFISLCSYVDRAYDKSCRAQKLKRRSIEYRIFRKQYKSKAYLIFYLLSIFFVGTVLMLITFSAFVLVLALGKSIFDNANDTTQLIMLIFVLVVSLAFAKYIDKH